MRIAFLTFVTLVAFAANSVLNRAALQGQGMDPALFTGIRLASGALALALIVAAGREGAGGGRLLRAGSWPSAAALAGYALAFSYAYVSLDVATGALILFGGVQTTMFAGSVLAGGRPGPWRWMGAAAGLSGLFVLFLPQAQRPDATGAALMALAAFSWGIYSLRGKRSRAPTLDTAGNFLRTVPLAALLFLPLLLDGGGVPPAGVALAIASGALASGLGYALWYSVLPALEPSVAAVSQLSVPLIVLAGGALFLGETPPAAFLPAAALTLGGVAMAVLGGPGRR